MGDAYERWSKRWAAAAHERVVRTDEVLDAMDDAIRAVWDRLAARIVRAARAATPADRRVAIRAVLDRAVEALLRSLADALVAGRRIAAESLARSIPAELLPDLLAQLVASRQQPLTESDATLLSVDLPVPPRASGALTPDQIRDAIAAVILPPLDRPTLLRAWSERAGVTATRSLVQRLSDRLWPPAAKTAIEVALTDGLARGQTGEELVRRIRSVVSSAAWQARRIARTEARRALEHDHLDRTLTVLGDMVQGLVIQAVLDDRTRPEHAARHGTIYYRQPDGTYRDRGGRPAPDLPDAPNCRCTYVPVLRAPERTT